MQCHKTSNDYYFELTRYKIIFKKKKKRQQPFIVSIHKEAVIIHQAGRWKKVQTVHKSIKKLQASWNLSVFVSFRMNKATMY